MYGDALTTMKTLYPGTVPDASHPRPPPQARVDHVTLLPNRLQLMDALEGRDRPTVGQHLMLVTLADARHYNEILRALGHAFADGFVRAGAAAVKACLPEGTIVYHVSVLSLAFVVAADQDRPLALATKLVRVLRQPLTCDDLPIATRAGVGLVALGLLHTSPPESLRAALAAAQDSRGRPEGWAEYNRTSDEAHQRSFQLLTDLRRAMTGEGELSIVYQPRVNMQNGRTEGAEALIRWTHPLLGPIPPNEFIPLAEATALITPLTEWVMTRVLRDMRTWPPAWQGVRVSVNVSPISLHQPHFAEGIGTLLDAFRIAPDRLELEFTEGALTATGAAVGAQTNRIRELGITIAIDDFGTGYSNLEYLIRLPAQILKIDQSFIGTMDREPRRQVLARAIIELAHSLGYRVVAEGIETDEIYALLRDWGCDEGQGYFIARPMPPPQFHAWLQNGLG